MRILILTLLSILVAGTASAQLGAECAKPFNVKYSYKDFMNKSFKDIDKSEFNNTCIIGSNFYQEWDWDRNEIVVKDIFPNGAVGIEFIKCNLDNVKVLPNHSIDSITINRKIKVQNDWDDWILDDLLKPVEPMDKQRRLDVGLSIDPLDIPSQRWTKAERRAHEKILNPSVNP